MTLIFALYFKQILFLFLFTIKFNLFHFNKVEDYVKPGKRTSDNDNDVTVKLGYFNATDKVAGLLISVFLCR